MVIIEFLTLVFAATLLFFVATQVILPLVKGELTFPIFRKRRNKLTQEYKEANEKEELDNVEQFIDWKKNKKNLN